MNDIGSTLPRAGTWSHLKGVFATVVLIGVVEVLRRYVSPVPTPVGIGTLGVVYAAFVGGTWSGLASAALLALYGAYCFSMPGAPFQFDANGLWRLSVAIVVPPTIVLVMGVLKGRSDRANEVLRQQAIMEAQIAERARSHHALLQSRDEQQTIFHSVPAMIWFKDKKGRILRANRNAAQSIGRSVEEVEGKSTHELYPDEAAKYQQDDAEVIESGRPKLGIVERYEIPGGEKRWIRTDKIPYYDASGKIVGVVVFAVDITEQKKAQEALQQAHDELDRRVQVRTSELTQANERLRREIAEREKVEGRLQQIIDNTTAVIYVKDAEGRYVLINRRFEELFHVRREHMAGRTDYDVFPEEAAEAFRANDRRVFESGQPVQFEETVPHDDGPHHYISLKFPLCDAEGRPMAVCGISADITERKHSEQVVAERAFLAQFAADVGIALTRGEDLRTMLQRCCEAMVRHLDAAFARIWTLNDSTATLELQASAGMYTHLDGGHARIPMGSLKIGWIAQERKPHLTNNVMSDPRIGDYEWAKREGMTAFAGYPLLIGDRVIGVMALFARKPLSDLVTEAMESVADTIALGIERLRASLDLQEHVRALEEANEALGRAEEAAKAASRAKSRFLANISHEIRTPIMAMLGAAELLQAGELRRNDCVDRGDMILRNGRHLLSLVDELLDLSRLEAGKLEIHPEDCSLVEILADVDSITEPLRRNKKIDYRIVYETQVPEHIRTDCTRLTQAVINLVSNALKFTEKGFVRLRVRVDRDAPEPRLTIVVEDSGIGIRPEDRERIFDSFTQVEPISSGATAGVGLGLPIARWIAEKLDGTLEVQSVYGKGSAFILRIATGPLDGVPWITVPEPSGRSSTPLPGARHKAPRQLQGRVLLGDDASDIRELIAFTLRRCGAEVTTVENGRQAVEAAMSDTFDLILLDIRMPELDGLSAAMELRRRGCRSRLIALTASTSDRQREQILTSGFDDFWAKPISLDDLAQRVALHLPSPMGAIKPFSAQGKDRGAANGPPGQPSLQGSRALELPGAANGERMTAVVAEFVASLPKRAGAIRAAIEGGDLPRARDLLHQLVGTSGIHGFMSISHEAARLMQIVKNGAFTNAPEELQALEGMIADLLPRGSPNVSSTGGRRQDS